MLAWFIAILIVLSVVMSVVMFISILVHLRREKVRTGKSLKDVCSGTLDPFS